MVGLSIKNCLLRLDFAFVNLCGEAWIHLDPSVWTLPSTASRGRDCGREATVLWGLGRCLGHGEGRTQERTLNVELGSVPFCCGKASPMSSKGSVGEGRAWALKVPPPPTSSLPQVLSKSPGSSAGTGTVCPGRWMLSCLATSTSQALCSSLPRPRSKSLNIAAANATAHVVAAAAAAAAAAARAPQGSPVLCSCPSSPVKRQGQ